MQHVTEDHYKGLEAELKFFNETMNEMNEILSKGDLLPPAFWKKWENTRRKLDLARLARENNPKGIITERRKSK